MSEAQKNTSNVRTASMTITINSHNSFQMREATFWGLSAGSIPLGVVSPPRTELMFIVSLLELSEVTGRMCDFKCPLRNTSQLSRRAARVQVDDKSDYRVSREKVVVHSGR
jgi:hypothetical protein